MTPITSTDLHAQIMNLPCIPAKMPLQKDERFAYVVGHRDARHAAAELVSAAEPAKMTQAASDVLAERERQQSKEGWTPQHDDAHGSGEMAMAAACYAAHSSVWQTIEYTTVRGKPGLAQRLISAQEFVHRMWPWGRDWWKPKDDRSNLVRAAALILAEIERLDRAAKNNLQIEGEE